MKNSNAKNLNGSNDELEMLRLEIDRVDKNIVKLLAKRMEAVKKVGDLKRKMGMAVTDKGREDKVVEKWEDIAKQLHLPQGMAGSIVKTIFPYSKINEVKSSRKHTICIIGYGSMAKVLAWAMLNAGNDVVITGRNLEKARLLSEELGCSSSQVDEALAHSEYVILALPPSALDSDFVRSSINRFSGKIVMDIASEKYNIFHALQKLAKTIGFSYVSTHPLFGGFSIPVGEKIVIIRSGNSVSKSAEDEIAGFYSEIGIEPVFATLEEHEKAMSIVQVLPHFMTLSLKYAIEEMVKRYGIDSDKFSTPNFRSVKELIAGVDRNLNTVMEIQEFNKFAGDARKYAIKSINAQAKRFASLSKQTKKES